MPLTPTVEKSDFVGLATRTRASLPLRYVIALATVVAATLLRSLIEPYAMPGIPFITYYPAVIIATIFGGMWPGILVALISAVLAWFDFIPPELAFSLTTPVVVSLVLFLVISGINIAVVMLLNRSIERLVAQERNIRVLVEGAPNGILVVDEKGVIRTMNKSAEALFGYDHSELVGQRVERLLPRAKRVSHLADRREYIQNPSPRPMGAGRDLTALRKDGAEVPVEIGLSPITRDDETAVLATVVDISERKAAEKKQKFFVQELEHRSQNLFSVIQSIAARSLVEGKSLTEAKEIFEGRLMALSRAHRMLAEAAWTGAPLDQIIRNEVLGFADYVSVNGCELMVNTPAAQQFALIVHELATNAAKYGALSAPTGKVVIEGKVERVNGEQFFAMEWRERGGPPVRRPRRKGFGSTILVDGAKQFGRHAELRFERQGLSYELRLPLSSIAAGPSLPQTPATQAH